MTERRSLVSGDVMADRYHLQDLVHERLGAATWRAHDAVLSRNVGLELLPSDDPRADRFLDAARQSTAITDPRFLRVLDLVEDDRGHHLVVREWARAFPLDAVLAQSPLPPWRAAAVVLEVAEALAHAHSLGQYHRRLTPHRILLKQSGAVRVVGLGVALALAPTGRSDESQRHELEQLDVQGLGKLLYACLVSRWPGGHVDGLRAAPTEHGRILRPRQVRAGVDREIDSICDRILSQPPMHHRPALSSAEEIAHELRDYIAHSEHRADLVPIDDAVSPDLMRHDPVVVPLGPPPGLEPPRRRPKAYEPAEPTAFERSKERLVRATRGELGLMLLGAVGVLVIISVLAFLAGQSDSGSDPQALPGTAQSTSLAITDVSDLDPQGADGQENPEQVDLAVDGDPDTGWTTSNYYNRPDLGGLKDGVGLVVDLGGPRDVRTVRLALGGSPTSLSIYSAAASVDGMPDDLEGLTEVARVDDAGTDVTVSLPAGTLTRYVVVWLRELPPAAPGEFRGEIRDIAVEGHS